MKKEYSKPMFKCEHFSLLQNVASMCDGVPGGGTSNLGRPTWGSPSNCTWELPNWSLFASDTSRCDVPLDIIGEFSTGTGQALCYNNPNGGITVFGS